MGYPPCLDCGVRVMGINVLSLQVARCSPPVRPYAEGKTWGSLCLPINSPELTLSGDAKSGLRVVKALVEVTQWSQADMWAEENDKTRLSQSWRLGTMCPRTCSRLAEVLESPGQEARSM